METVECKSCKRIVFLIEQSDEFCHRGEMNLVFVCPDESCGAMTRLELLGYKAKSKNGA